MGVVYRIQLDRELGAPTLPEPTASLIDQKEAVRALKTLYPGIKIGLSSIRVLPSGKRVVRELQV